MARSPGPTQNRNSALGLGCRRHNSQSGTICRERESSALVFFGLGNRRTRWVARRGLARRVERGFWQRATALQCHHTRRCVTEPVRTPDAGNQRASAKARRVEHGAVLLWTRTNGKPHPPDLTVSASLPFCLFLLARRRPSHLSGNAVYLDLAAQSDNNFRNFLESSVPRGRKYKRDDDFGRN